MDKHSILTYSGARIVGNLFVVVRVTENRLYPTFVLFEVVFFSRSADRTQPQIYTQRARDTCTSFS